MFSDNKINVPWSLFRLTICIASWFLWSAQVLPIVFPILFTVFCGISFIAGLAAIIIYAINS